MRHRIPGLLFEAVAEAGVDTGGGTGDEGGTGDDGGLEVTPDPGAHEINPERVPPPEAPEPAAASFDYEAPEFQSAVERAAQERLDAYFAQQNQPEPVDPNAAWTERLASLDPLDDDYGQQVAQTFAEALAASEQRILEQVQQTPASQAAEEAFNEKWEADQFGAIEKKVGGDIDPELRGFAREAALAGAVQIGRDMQVTVVRDPGDALSDSATRLHAYVAKREQAAVEAYRRGLAGDGAPSHEPPAGGVAAVRSETPAESASEVTQRFLSRFG